MRRHCIILAGGEGTRFDNALPKQFLSLGGEPIVVRTVKRVLAYGGFATVVVAVHAKWMIRFGGMLEAAGIDRRKIRVVRGGPQRNDSMANGLQKLLKLGVPRDDVVVVCDAVRPFVTTALLNRCADEAAFYGASVAVVPAVDTMLEVDGGVVVSVPRRSRMFNGQTPCGARVGILARALESGWENDNDAITGTAQLLLRSGATVMTFPGAQTNFKITTAEDLRRAETMLALSDRSD